MKPIAIAVSKMILFHTWFSNGLRVGSFIQLKPV
jgi:hypothetical protein